MSSNARNPAPSNGSTTQDSNNNADVFCSQLGQPVLVRRALDTIRVQGANGNRISSSEGRHNQCEDSNWFQGKTCSTVFLCKCRFPAL